MKDKEIWKDIKNYEGYYQVSNLGRIKRVERKVKIKNRNREYELLLKENILQGYCCPKGYIRVLITKDTKAKTYMLHRLVAETFISNPNNLPQVNHIDGNKLNNRIDNLEWCTAKENTHHAWKNGLNSTEKYTHYTRPIKQIKGNKVIAIYISTKEASDTSKISKKAINNCLKGRCHTSGGFKWEYIKEV